MESWLAVESLLWPPGCGILAPDFRLWARGYGILAPGSKDVGSWSWDPAESSLALYLYDKLGKEGVDAAVAVGKNKEAGPKDVLNHLPTEIVEEVASSLAVVMPTKSDVLSQIASVIG